MMLWALLQHNMACRLGHSCPEDLSQCSRAAFVCRLQNNLKNAQFDPLAAQHEELFTAGFTERQHPGQQ